jgi:hypothetical protein
MGLNNKCGPPIKYGHGPAQLLSGFMGSPILEEKNKTKQKVIGLIYGCPMQISGRPSGYRAFETRVSSSMESNDNVERSQAPSQLSQ